MAKLFFLKIFLLVTIILTFSYVNVKKKSINLKEKIMEKIQKNKEDRNQKEDSDKSKNPDENKDSNENTETNRIFNNYKEGYQNFQKENSQDTNPDGEDSENSSGKSNAEKFKDNFSKENAKSFWEKSKKSKVKCSIKFRKILEFIYKICGYILKFFMWIWDLIKEPVKELFKSALGEYYTVLTAPFLAIFKIYKFAIKSLLFVIKLPFKLARALFRIIGSCIIRVLKVFPGRWFLDILAYIITIPYLFIIPIEVALSPITNAFGVFCWSDRGLYYEIEDNVNWTIDNLELVFEKAAEKLKYSAGM
jgi:hypothetical protein